MKRYIFACIVLTVTAGCSLLDPYGFRKQRFQWQGEPTPICADEVLAAARTLAICKEGVIDKGVVYWMKDLPFNCDGRLVWGCGQPELSYVKAFVAVTPSGYATDGALAHELAHWMFVHCKQPKGETDPEFVAWHIMVNNEARKACLGANK